MVGLGRMGGNMARRLARGGSSGRCVRSERAGPRCTGRRTAGTDDRRARRRAGCAQRAAHGVGDAACGCGDRLSADRAGRPARAWRPRRRRRQRLLPRLPAPGRRAGRATAFTSSTPASAAECGDSVEGYGLMVGGADDDIARLDPGAADAGARRRRRVGCTSGRSALATSPRWCTTASSTDSCRPMPRASRMLHARDDLVTDIAAVADAWRERNRHPVLVARSRGVVSCQPTRRLADVAPEVADSGEGRWTVHEAVDLGVPAPVITAALYERFAEPGQGRLRRQAAGAAAPRVRRARGHAAAIAAAPLNRARLQAHDSCGMPTAAALSTTASRARARPEQRPDPRRGAAGLPRRRPSRHRRRATPWQRALRRAQAS